MGGARRRAPPKGATTGIVAWCAVLATMLGDPSGCAANHTGDGRIDGMETAVPAANETSFPPSPPPRRPTRAPTSLTSAPTPPPNAPHDSDDGVHLGGYILLGFAGLACCMVLCGKMCTSRSFEVASDFSGGRGGGRGDADGLPRPTMYDEFQVPGLPRGGGGEQTVCSTSGGGGGGEPGHPLANTSVNADLLSNRSFPPLKPRNASAIAAPHAQAAPPPRTEGAGTPLSAQSGGNGSPRGVSPRMGDAGSAQNNLLIPPASVSPGVAGDAGAALGVGAPPHPLSSGVSSEDMSLDAVLAGGNTERPRQSSASPKAPWGSGRQQPSLSPHAAVDRPRRRASKPVAGNTAPRLASTTTPRGGEGGNLLDCTVTSSNGAVGVPAKGSTFVDRDASKSPSELGNTLTSQLMSLLCDGQQGGGATPPAPAGNSSLGDLDLEDLL